MTSTSRTAALSTTAVSVLGLSCRAAYAQYANPPTMAPLLQAIIALAILLVVLIIYLLPTIIAFRKAHPNRWVIFAINLFGGALGGLGWIIALIWALRAFHAPVDDRYRDARDGGESGLNMFANDTKRVSVRHEPPMARQVEPTRSPTGSSTAQRLLELKRMKDAGEISAEEFAELKNELIGR